jgi:cellobiose phosphorylase
LQDVLGLVYTAPAIARSHIIRAASHQFVEGDVQHWWHPPSDAGVRTRISDDLLWLPWVTAHYVKITGDQEILNTIISFLEGRPLEPHEHEVFLSPLRSLEEASLLEHCRRAIRKGLTAGPHGLPLIGAGDWNDGMNQVGIEGKGESVWLAWFIADVLREFADLLHLRGEELEADECRERAARIVEAVENEAWDGNWYRRAYFDGGTPLGSQQNEEAKIDSIAQSWAVLSGAADPARAAQALEAADEILVRRAERLVLLFTPPFNKSADNPGYIKSYPPGVRENGGQYTHAAIWLASAFARRHDGDKAVEILNILNPVLRCRNREEVEIYKVEPYILAGDVYSLEHQVGRGGWTWYTGSSGWMYRVWLEDVLGFKLRGKFLHINPCIAREWDGYSLHYRYGGSRYHIHVENPDHVVRGVEWIELDGQRSEDQPVLLQDDGTDHTIRVRLGR